MIEKLKVVVKPEDWKLPVNELEMRCLKNLLLKVDELVDAVNELQECVNDHDQAFDDCARDITKIETMLKDINTTNSKMENVAENGESSKTERGSFAEQRKWIGKICKFWNWFGPCLVHYSKLITIKDTNDGEMTNCPFRADDGNWYMCCEPVLSTDDAIYKGGDNDE